LVSANEHQEETTGLDARERRIVALARQGATDREIADDLDLSVAALRTCWLRVRGKLGAVNRTHAIALATHDASPAETSNPRQRLVDALTRDRVATWVWQPRSRQALLDETGSRLFAFSVGDGLIPQDRLLAHIWTPDRARFERFLCQGPDLRPMTPIELRVGIPGEYHTLLRTVNVVSGPSPESTLLLASTTIHTFSN